jgi:RNase P subunit RPR2
MPYKRLEPDVKEIAKRWLAGMIWKAAPERTIQCRLCPALIPGGTKVYRYITGFRGETPQLAFACNECGQELVEFMIERLQKLLPMKEERCPREPDSPIP